MDAATVKAMLEQHFTSDDPYRSHAMYHDDAVLEFPQSGERFVGVENLRAWRSNYPASTRVEFREIRGSADLWVVELSIRYADGPWNLGVSILELRGEKDRPRVDLRHRGLGSTRVASRMAVRAIAASREPVDRGDSSKGPSRSGIPATPTERPTDTPGPMPCGFLDHPPLDPNAPSGSNVPYRTSGSRSTPPGHSIVRLSGFTRTCLKTWRSV
jgi:SnoaL-like domain